jgi:hypothetical protein
MIVIATLNGLLFFPVVLSLIGGPAMPIGDFMASLGVQKSKDNNKSDNGDETLNNPLYELSSAGDSKMQLQGGMIGSFVFVVLFFVC